MWCNAVVALTPMPAILRAIYLRSISDKCCPGRCLGSNWNENENGSLVIMLFNSYGEFDDIPEISDFDGFIRADKNISGGQIPMHNLLLRQKILRINARTHYHFQYWIILFAIFTMPVAICLAKFSKSLLSNGFLPRRFRTTIKCFDSSASRVSSVCADDRAS